MSYRVMFVCEDHTLDQYILRPVLKSLLNYLGKPKADVRAVTDPKLSGIGDLRRDMCSIVTRYTVVSDLLIIAVDGDCVEDRQSSFEEALAQCPGHEKALVVVARQELEVWAIWGSKDELGDGWSTITQECHPKETYFEGLAKPGDARRPDRGRTRLTSLSLGRGWRSLAQGCPELGELEARVRPRLST